MEPDRQISESGQNSNSTRSVANESGISSSNGSKVFDNRASSQQLSALTNKVSNSQLSHNRAIVQAKADRFTLDQPKAGFQSNGSIQLKDKYDDEIDDFNKGKEKSKQIRDPEKPIYKDLRKAGFEQDEIKMPGSGADFVAANADKLAIIEVKGGNSGKWTKDDNLNFKSGNHVPAKQIKESINNKRAEIKEKLKLKSSDLFLKSKLRVAVTNLADKDAMMALVVTDKHDIKYQHPVTLGQVISFIVEVGKKKIETVLEDLDEVSDNYWDWLIENDVYNEVTEQDAFKEATEEYVTDWSEKKIDALVQNLDVIEVFYNAARLNHPHMISKSGDGKNNPDSVDSLAELKKKEKEPIHIRLIPVGSSV